MLPRKTGYASASGKQTANGSGWRALQREKQREDREEETSKGLPRNQCLAQGAEYRGKYLREDCRAVGMQSERLSHCQNATG